MIMMMKMKVLLEVVEVEAAVPLDRITRVSEHRRRQKNRFLS
jgi:hypothetical protein